MTRLAPMLPRGCCGPAPKRFDRDIHAGYYVRCASVTTSSLDAPRHLACMPDIWASASWLGASHNVNMAGILARFGLIDRSIGTETGTRLVCLCPGTGRKRGRG
jgi:hypothetical protein